MSDSETPLLRQFAARVEGGAYECMMSRFLDTLFGFVVWYTLWHATDFVLALLHIK